MAAEPRLVALGPDQPALQLEQPVASDTVSRTDTVLLAAVGNGLREVVRFPSRIDNRLHLQCDGEEAAAADAGHADPDSLPGSATDSLPTGLAAAEIEARAAADCDDHLLAHHHLAGRQQRRCPLVAAADRTDRRGLRPGHRPAHRTAL